MTRYPAHSLSVPVIMFSDAIITGRGCLRTPTRGGERRVPWCQEGFMERGREEREGGCSWGQKKERREIKGKDRDLTRI